MPRCFTNNNNVVVITVKYVLIIIVMQRQDYQCWCDLRKLELQVGERFLTHASDDSRWNQYRLDHGLPDWSKYGHANITVNDRFNFNKSRQMPPSPS